MQVIKLDNYCYQNKQIGNLQVVVDACGGIVILPLLYSSYITRNLSHFETKTKITATGVEETLNTKSIGENTIKTYLPKIKQFMEYVEEKFGEEKVHRLYELTSTEINEYLNKELSSKLQLDSISAHKSAIDSFFTFLTYLGIRKPHKTLITGEGKNAAKSNKKKKKINYVASQVRRAMVRKCKNRRDKLILKIGYEVGLRTRELQGLLVKPLKKLFAELENEENKTKGEFSYWLDGNYTKGGRGRYIFFSRELLVSMSTYLTIERTALAGVESFFTTNGIEQGRPISARTGSDVFTRIKKKIASIKDTELSYHDLRHTFATELYHDELLDSEGNETRSESAALLVVAERLGHALNKKTGKPAEVTLRYIRLRAKMLEEEGLS